MIIQGQQWIFDTVAEDYDRIRPGYCTALYDELFAYAPVGTGSRVLEIGIGAGQATHPVLQTGCKLTAVEYGENFSEICRRKFGAFSNFQMITSKFEDAVLQENAWDLIYSAAAFHWIPEEIGYRKVYSLLKPEGAFARFACHPDRTRLAPELSEELDLVYAKYYYPYYHKEPEKPAPYTREQAYQRSRLAEKYGFIETGFALFERERTLSAREYRTLLGTYSDHVSIEEPIRSKFFDAVEDVIERHGGTLTLVDIMDLETARKPAR